jgi:hypothetical protein
MNCPFCNGVLPALPAPPTDKRPCPRCGEPVPPGRWPVDPSATAIASGPPPGPKPSDVKTANRKTGYIIIGLMAAMAIIGLSYALWTTQLRRSRDPKKVDRFEPIKDRRPLELTALGYLPKNSQLVAGIHVAEMLNDKAGKQLLAEPRPALLDWAIQQITRTSALKLEDLDHIVLASAFDAHFPQLVMIVKTRPPIDLQKIAEARPRKSKLHEEKPLYEFTLDPFGEALVWNIDERTLIYVIRVDAVGTQHLHGLSATPRKLDEGLSAPLQKAMKERLPRHPYLWAAGRLDNLGMAKDWLPLIVGARAELASLKEIRIFTLGVEPVEGLTLKGDFQLANAKSAAAFKSLLEGVRLDGARSQKVESSPANEAEQWVSWQVRGDVSAMRELLNRGKGTKK